MKEKTIRGRMIGKAECMKSIFSSSITIAHHKSIQTQLIMLNTPQSLAWELITTERQNLEKQEPQPTKRTNTEAFFIGINKTKRNHFFHLCLSSQKQKYNSIRPASVYLRSLSNLRPHLMNSFRSNLRYGPCWTN